MKYDDSAGSNRKLKIIEDLHRLQGAKVCLQTPLALTTVNNSSVPIDYGIGNTHYFDVTVKTHTVIHEDARPDVYEAARKTAVSLITHELYSEVLQDLRFIQMFLYERNTSADPEAARMINNLMHKVSP